MNFGLLQKTEIIKFASNRSIQLYQDKENTHALKRYGLDCAKFFGISKNSVGRILAAKYIIEDKTPKENTLVCIATKRPDDPIIILVPSII